MSETTEIGGISAPSDEELGAGLPEQEPQQPEQREDAPQEPEAAPETPEQAEKRTRMVPHEALHEARTREREARQRAEMAERRFDEYQAIVRQQLAGQQAPKQEAPPLPDVNVDPVGYFKARDEQREQELAQLRQPIQQQQHLAAFQQAYATQAHQFASNTPDFNDAYAHATSVFANAAPFMGLSSGVEVERHIADQAMRAGKNPGQAVYEFAQKFGYAPKAAETPAPAPAPAAPDLGAVSRGQAASSGAGRGGDPGGSGEMSALELSRMPFKEFNAWVQKNPEKADRLMGKGR